ncbi:hypothetical protein CGH72_21300 [Vibrio parahaemolyticus]|uniref:hypothetical protein n=2 Tax=Vibrio parahaemolyticus TaxID=670 RepID=UPI001122F8FC|nr:hypothetical protein [Vibrio parahaemolyticus]TOM65765.1 hypothetical protein CGH73_17390 [Vibrio parahaemolyticus]TOM67024.1 hypothetical protein CGH72_21300 [Vibrio parahaemolyticus]TOO88492.1 hypothetical protein CGH29_07195 [Vibrio parahaemolyticus]
MSNVIQYPDKFPTKHIVKAKDIITLYENENWDALNDIVICRDRSGKVTANFGQKVWDIRPISRSKYKGKLDFCYLDDAPELQLQLKLIIYGWLFHKSRSSQNALAISTIISRFSDINHVYQHLANIGAPSLSILSNEKEWTHFEDVLMDKNLSQTTLEKLFVSINAALNLQPWLKCSFRFERKIKSKVLALKLSERERQQTLVIPERLSDDIYGKAIELIKEAHPYREKIAATEVALQQNYLEGKRIVNENIRNGSRYIWTNEDGEIIDNIKYTRGITDHLPIKTKDILGEIQGEIKGIKLDNGLDFQRYLGQLITACYIACGAFSGMRDSELGELTPDSYYMDTFAGRDYHMLQSRTFKLGEKRTTWVAAPIAEKAVELISTLTAVWRKERREIDSNYSNTVWCNRIARSKPPTIIPDWPSRLKRFCQHFGIIITPEDYQECLDSNPQALDKVKNDVIVGSPWPLAPHQFRRSLAYYTIKHRLGTTIALKQQFKHLYLSMTEWYTNGGRLASIRELAVDEKMQAALDEITAESTTDKIFKQWHSNELLSGKHGKAIIKMRGNIPHIYSSWKVIYQAVKKGTLTLHGTAHSYCKNGYKCDMDGVVMPQFCVSCDSESSIIDKEQAKWWQKKHQSCVRYMELGEDISHTDRSHYITQIRAAESVMRDFDMPFTPFEHDIKVAEL